MSVGTIEIEEEIPRENRGTESVGKHMQIGKLCYVLGFKMLVLPHP